MKSSVYNIFVPTETTGEFYLYNTLTRAVYLVDDEGRCAIENVDATDMSTNLSMTLYDDGIWCDDHVDERALFRVLHDRYRYERQYAFFTLFLTYLCDVACPYCYLNYLIEGGRPSRSMDLDRIDRVSEFIKNVVQENNCRELYVFVTGGEPFLLLEGIVRILSELKTWSAKQGICFNVGMFVNGVSIDREMVRRVAEFKPFMQVTLCGSEHFHNQVKKLPNGKGTYDTVIHFLRMLKEEGIDFGIRVNVDRNNYRTIDQLLDDLKERVGPGLHIRFLPVIPGAKIPQSDWSRACLQGMEFTILTKLWYLADERGFKVVLDSMVNPLFCSYLTDTAYVVGPFYDVYKCDGAVGIPQCCIGKIDEKGNLIECKYAYYDWMSRDPLNIPRCCDCKLLPMCGGGCPGIALDEHGTYHRESCRLCHMIFEEMRFRFEKLEML